MYFCSVALLFLAFGTVCHGQTVCPSPKLYEACDMRFELSPEERAKHPNPYLTVQLTAELRSPRHRTISLPAFWDGKASIVRFAPTEPGTWTYRLTGNLGTYSGKEGQMEVAASDSPGFIRPANGHHWIWTESRKAHLWMGDTSYGFAWLSDADFEKLLQARQQQKFTHIRGYGIGREDYQGATFRGADRPDEAFYSRLDSRVRALNQAGLCVDLILGHARNHLSSQFPTWQQREQYLRYMVARYSAFHVTWQLTQEWEEYDKGRDLMREMGLALKKLDPYDHPRTAHTMATSSPLAGDGWMDHLSYRSSDDQLGSIEHQMFALPAVNAGFAYEDSGGGKAGDHDVDEETFRHRLWNSAMNGQYPVFGNTGAYGWKAGKPFDAKYLTSPGSRAMTVWFDFTAGNRYWELEPYFDLDGGRALALHGTEYIVYVEKPAGPIEVRIEKHGYNVRWLDPRSGEVVPAKDFNGEKFVAEPPDRSHDWVLHLSRDGRKAGMLQSYKFESRPFLMQEIESAGSKVPYEFAEPGEEVKSLQPGRYAAKLKKDTRGTRSMMYLWTGEIGVEGSGARVVGTGAEGTLKLPASFQKIDGVMNLRLLGMNANGKLYSADRIVRLRP